MNKGLLLALVTIVFAMFISSCDFFGNKPERSLYENEKPRVREGARLNIPSILLDVTTDLDPIGLDSLFTDRNGDALSYRALADDLNDEDDEDDDEVVDVNVNGENKLVITPMGIGASKQSGIGRARLTIIAEDAEKDTTHYKQDITVFRGIGIDTDVEREIEEGMYATCDNAFILIPLERLFIFHDSTRLDFEQNVEASTIGDDDEQNVGGEKVLRIDPGSASQTANVVLITASDSQNESPSVTASLEININQGLRVNPDVRASIERMSFVEGETPTSIDVIQLGLFERVFPNDFFLELGTVSNDSTTILEASKDGGELKIEPKAAGSDIVKAEGVLKMTQGSIADICAITAELNITVEGNSVPMVNDEGEERMEMVDFINLDSQSSDDSDGNPVPVCSYINGITPDPDIPNGAPLFFDEDPLTYTAVRQEVNGAGARIDVTYFEETTQVCVVGLAPRFGMAQNKYPQVRITAFDGRGGESTVDIRIPYCPLPDGEGCDD